MVGARLGPEQQVDLGPEQLGPGRVGRGAAGGQRRHPLQGPVVEGVDVEQLPGALQRRVHPVAAGGGVDDRELVGVLVLEPVDRPPQVRPEPTLEAGVGVGLEVLGGGDHEEAGRVGAARLVEVPVGAARPPRVGDLARRGLELGEAGQAAAHRLDQLRVGRDIGPERGEGDVAGPDGGVVGERRGGDQPLRGGRRPEHRHRLGGALGDLGGELARATRPPRGGGVSRDARPRRGSGRRSAARRRR